MPAASAAPAACRSCVAYDRTAHQVAIPDVGVRVGGAHRFLPSGLGLVYLRNVESKDFWLLDFATNTTRQLTHLDDRGFLSTFDITPDGKYLVFDRTRQNSDIVLIDLPRR